jgi:Flp pilus assembly protein TadB
MKKNIGTTDKLVRLIIAFVLLLLVWFGKVTDTTMQIVVLAVAFIAALTSFLDYCPLYALFRFSTDKNE